MTQRRTRQLKLRPIEWAYRAALRKAKRDMKAKAEAAAKEKDPVLRIAKKPFVFPEELR
jgi:hypothetical protein